MPMTSPELRILTAIANIDLPNALTVVSKSRTRPGPGTGRSGNGTSLERCDDSAAGVSATVRV